MADDPLALGNVVASVMNFDQKYGIKIVPSKEASWAAVRDKLVNGELDASHVLYGLTYGVVPLTYRVYMEMLPDLSPELKREIKAQLLEAREYAMDAGSSDAKHAWFGKYKGRINNILSKAGYDLKKAEQEMKKR